MWKMRKERRTVIQKQNLTKVDEKQLLLFKLVDQRISNGACETKLAKTSKWSAKLYKTFFATKS